MEKQNQNQNKQWEVPFAESCIKEVYPEYSNKMLEQMLQNDDFNYGLGCILGSCIGDALGSYCQFQPELIQAHIERVMKMDGGGTFQTQPGQLTDDTQLARHLLSALSKNYDKNKTIQEQTNRLIVQIAMGYAQWMESQPFDKGYTCSGAFKVLIADKLNETTPGKTEENLEPIIKEFLTKISIKNNNSQSNGSLMRIAPMGFFTAIIKDSQDSCELLIRKQIALTHSNYFAIDCSYQWVKMLRKLIKRTDKIKNLKEILDKTKEDSKQILGDWVQQSQKKQLMCATDNMGWVKIAWTMGLNQLEHFCNLKKEDLNSSLFTATMRKVIQKGGDSDTNAAIVGGMAGAVVGFKKLPSQYLIKMMNLKFQKKVWKKMINLTVRPPFYEPRLMIVDAIKLYKKVKG